MGTSTEPSCDRLRRGSQREPATDSVLPATMTTNILLQPSSCVDIDAIVARLSMELASGDRTYVPILVPNFARVDIDDKISRGIESGLAIIESCHAEVERLAAVDYRDPQIEQLCDYVNDMFAAVDKMFAARRQRKWWRDALAETPDGRLALIEHDRCEQRAHVAMRALQHDVVTALAAGLSPATIDQIYYPRAAEIATPIFAASGRRIRRVVGARRLARRRKRSRSFRHLWRRRCPRARTRDTARGECPPRRRYSRPRGPPLI